MTDEPEPYTSMPEPPSPLYKWREVDKADQRFELVKIAFKQALVNQANPELQKQWLAGTPGDIAKNVVEVVDAALAAMEEDKNCEREFAGELLPDLMAKGPRVPVYLLTQRYGKREYGGVFCTANKAWAYADEHGGRDAFRFDEFFLDEGSWIMENPEAAELEEAAMEKPEAEEKHD